MKKRKVEILSVDSLVSMAKESFEKVMKDAEKAEKAHKEKVTSLTLEEKRLKAEIETGKEILETMSKDFDKFEKEKREAIAAELKESGMSKQDVIDGKVSLLQFQAQGLSDEAAKKMVMDSTSEALEESSDLVRAKGEEIIRIEHELYSTQTSIHGLLTQPIRSLRISYRSLGEMLDYQMESLLKEGSNSQYLKAQKENELTLIERGASVMSSGFIWRGITLAEAYRLRLNPIMFKKHIPSLLEQLNEIEPSGTARVTVTYHQPGSYWPGSPVEVREELPVLPPTKSKFKSVPVTTED